jgi:hypothetical protein
MPRRGDNMSGDYKRFFELEERIYQRVDQHYDSLSHAEKTFFLISC